MSQLLTELDGIHSKVDDGQKRRVVIVCATNRPDLLDDALMRPGRIDRMIYVGLPDEASRARIIHINLKGKSCADDIDVSCTHCFGVFIYCASDKFIHCNSRLTILPVAILAVACLVQKLLPPVVTLR